MKKSNIGLSISVVGLISFFILGMLGINYQALAFQKGMIGKLYQQQANTSFAYMFEVFEEITEEDVINGEMALETYGFTSEASWYLGRAMGLLEQNLVVIFGECFFFILLLFFLHKKTAEHKKETEELQTRIELLEQMCMKDEYQVQQNKRLQTFIENIAHQIKTPISRVNTSLYIVEEEIEDETLKERIEECFSHLENVNVLMKRLTDIGRLEAGKVSFKKEKISIETLIYEVVRSAGLDAGEVKLGFSQMEKLEYYGDFEWLKEAVLNIVKNGMEHNKVDAPLEISCSRDEECLKIIIRDYGEGISERDIPNLFDRFYLPENVKVNHTGIGLNLSKLIIEEHFGSIYVSNHVEGGAEFCIRLPVYALK